MKTKKTLQDLFFGALYALILFLPLYFCVLRNIEVGYSIFIIPVWFTLMIKHYCPIKDQMSADWLYTVGVFLASAVLYAVVIFLDQATAFLCLPYLIALLLADLFRTVWRSRKSAKDMKAYSLRNAVLRSVICVGSLHLVLWILLAVEIATKTVTADYNNGIWFILGYLAVAIYLFFCSDIKKLCQRDWIYLVVSTAVQFILLPIYFVVLKLLMGLFEEYKIDKAFADGSVLVFLIAVILLVPITDGIAILFKKIKEGSKKGGL